MTRRLSKTAHPLKTAVVNIKFIYSCSKEHHCLFKYVLNVLLLAYNKNGNDLQYKNIYKTKNYFVRFKLVLKTLILKFISG